MFSVFWASQVFPHLGHSTSCPSLTCSVVINPSTLRFSNGLQTRTKLKNEITTETLEPIALKAVSKHNGLKEYLLFLTIGRPDVLIFPPLAKRYHRSGYPLIVQKPKIKQLNQRTWSAHNNIVSSRHFRNVFTLKTIGLFYAVFTQNAADRGICWSVKDIIIKLLYRRRHGRTMVGDGGERLRASAPKPTVIVSSMTARCKQNIK